MKKQYIRQVRKDLHIPRSAKTEVVRDLQEIFASGTAAVISPIGWLNHSGEDIQVADGKVGPIAQKLYDALYGMQTGTREDDMGWIYKL